MSSTPLRRVRRRLTTWYLATFGAILLLLGGGLFVAIRHQFASELDLSLRDATTELERAAAIRESEAGLAGHVVDAVDELHIPDRSLFLLHLDGTPIRPERADAWIQAAGREAASQGTIDLDHEGIGERTLRLHAGRFALPTGRALVAVAVADKIELEDRYASLIAAFGAAALAALVLVAAAGSVLVGQSIGPIEQSVEQMRRFVADAAHELRTPLSVLRNRAEIALQQPRDEAGYVAALAGIEAESARLARIVDDLLTLARAESEPRAVERTRIFLDDIVLDAADAAKVVGERLGVVVTVGEFEEAPIEGDPHLVRQLVMILLDNAVKFTPAGGAVTVRVGRDGSASILRVIDAGPGIPPEQLPHVFERFYRGDPARYRSPAGTSGSGLGLSIARWIADAHGATLTLDPAEGGGTVATARFPVAAVPGRPG
ncbi:MAG: ATP-binding protein [Gemmatimonadota bacterium]